MIGSIFRYLLQIRLVTISYKIAHFFCVIFINQEHTNHIINLEEIVNGFVSKVRM